MSESQLRDPLSVFGAADASGRTVALITESGESLDYAALAQQTHRAAAWLNARGAFDLPPGSRVAVIARSDLDTFVLLHALIAHGIPMILVHERLSPRERADVLSAVPAALVVSEPWSQDEVTAPPPAPPIEVDSERELAVLFTSGSTGQPKGVSLSRRAFLAAAAASAARLPFVEGDRWLASLSFAHVGGLSILTRCLLARRTVVLGKFAPEALNAGLAPLGVTIVSLVPVMLRRAMSQGPPPDGLRIVLLGGAAASPSLLADAAQTGWPVLTTYGLTEAASQVSLQMPGTAPHPKEGSGRPLDGTEVRIVEGRIHIRGPTLMHGYLPEGAHGDPWQKDGWLDTGDDGRLDRAGRLHVSGRRSDRIITGGENVDPLEVEQLLSSQPHVREAVVFGVEDEEWGELVAAAITTEAGFDRARLTEALAQELAPFKRPRRLAILDEMPLGPSGKIARQAVRTQVKLEPL